MPAQRHGVHRRALTRAVKAAWWLDAEMDAAAVRAAADLADMLDLLRSTRLAEASLGGLQIIDSKAAWHAASVHQKFQVALAACRLTPDTRPEQVADDAADLIADLKRHLTDG